MSYLAVAYPKLATEDFDWIQSYRKRHDQLYFDVVAPHFTLVFGVSDTEEGIFLDEIRHRSANVGRFRFNLRVATINLDDLNSYYHEFLVPDEGYSNIVKLHDKLYSGILLPHLRFDLDFIPHVGIGNSRECLVSKNRVDELNSKGVDISGTVDTIDIIEYKDGIVRTLDAIPLI